MKNAINWFEIPSLDYERAVKFYGDIMWKELVNADMEWFKMSTFDYGEKWWVWWAVIYTPNIKPSFDWTTVYLNAWDDLDLIASRVEKNWWKIVISKMDIWDNMWFIVQFIDSEWNRVWLHGMK